MEVWMIVGGGLLCAGIGAGLVLLLKPLFVKEKKFQLPPPPVEERTIYEPYIEDETVGPVEKELRTLVAIMGRVEQELVLMNENFMAESELDSVSKIEEPVLDSVSKKAEAKPVRQTRTRRKASNV